MTLEERIVRILKTSKIFHEWPDEVYMKVALEIVDGLEANGWVIEHQSFNEGDE